MVDKSITLKYTLSNEEALTVQWDNRKDETNIKKHGLAFEKAAEVFKDLQRVELYDLEHSAYEDRYIVFGEVGLVITVVYTVRNGCYRLISARRASKTERDIYYGNSNKSY